ncbi:pirin family protein [Ferrimonas senticii]|uniref:pirin family protein n=1 Tax=Ferrimonas senticii TaxID=394566 RepID=UPI00040675A9|nr:pirin family protein [Ferrimonas senticii]
MITIHPAAARGRAQLNWLDSRHSFSFGYYYDPTRMGCSALRVLNDDIIAAGTGFEPHGHRDMEIISYVRAGQIVHRDNQGHQQTITAGEFQLMSAAQGIEHSEFNGSDSEPAQILQIWIKPNQLGGQPHYQQRHFGQQQGLTTIASGDGQQGSFTIKQDAKLQQLHLAPNTAISVTLAAERQLYLHQVDGELIVSVPDGLHYLSDGDGAQISEEAEITLSNHGSQPVMALLFELAND